MLKTWKNVLQTKSVAKSVSNVEFEYKTTVPDFGGQLMFVTVNF